MKKILSLFTAVLLLATLFVTAIPVAAAETARIELDKPSYKVGDVVVLTVYVDGEVKAGFGGISYAVDTGVFDFVNKSLAKELGVDPSGWNDALVETLEKDGDANPIITCTKDKAAFSADTEYDPNESYDLSTLTDGFFKLVLRIKAMPAGGKAIVPVNVVAKYINDTLVNTLENVEIKVECAEHDYGDWEELDDNDHVKTCSVCGDAVKGTHIWDEGVETTAPTCSDKGVKTYTCADCGATKTEDINPTGKHTFGDWADNGDGTHSRECTGSTCTEKETKDHVWDEGVETTAPTCCDEGVKTFTCVDCGATTTEDIEPTNKHTFGAWADNGDGTHTRECTGSTCDEKETKDHVWDEGVETTAPTCCDKGVKTYTCECGATTTEDIEPTYNHTFGAWADNGDGNHIRVCTGTNCTESETLPHDWTSVCDDLCDTCGATRVIDVSAHVCVRNHNSTGHWDACMNCDYTTPIVVHTMNGEFCTDCNYRLPVNQFVSGYLYVNEEYHMQIMSNGVITTKHVLDANGDCVLCFAHITDTEEIIVDVQDPIEPATEEEEDTTVDAEVEENPETGLALAAVPAIVALAAVALSKRR